MWPHQLHNKAVVAVIDLSFVYSQSDQDDLIRAANDRRRTNDYKGWIGLYQDPHNTSLWRWSGGGPMTYKNWAKGQPDLLNLETKVQLFSDGFWNNLKGTKPLPFYCVKLKMSWEKALDYCRENNRNLAPFSSEDDFTLKQTKNSQDINELIWVNLRYLGDRWLWVSGDSVNYQGWRNEDSREQCPVMGRCGALNKDGLLVNWDCQAELYFFCK